MSWAVLFFTFEGKAAPCKESNKSPVSGEKTLAKADSAV
jgi:hypothetical protein